MPSKGECLLFFPPSLEKDPLRRAYCALLYHRGNSAKGIQALLMVINGRTTRESHWRSDIGLLRRSLTYFSVNRTHRESIFSLPSVCSCPPGPALPHTAWGVMSCCPDESKAFYGWAHLSSVVSPQL